MEENKIEKTFYSFKDVAARVIKIDGIFNRFIHQSYRNEMTHLMDSGLYNELVSKQLIIPHITLQGNQMPSGYILQILPQQIPFLVEPFEWTFSEWQQAALTCIEINQIALSYGMLLKDATPYNFAKVGGKMLMFDTTSFQFFIDKSPWVAYRQFCMEFLGPLALIKFGGSVWSRLTRTFVKGMPLEFISKALPFRSYLNMQCLIHLHLHSQFKPNSKDVNGISTAKGFTTEGLQFLLGSFSKSIVSWSQKAKSKSLWDHYYEKDLEHEAYLTNKSNQIVEWMERTKPTKVVDLGANTGHFSLLASDYCEQVLAIENNVDCVELLNQSIAAKEILNITTALADLTQLSPDMGNGFQEIRNICVRGRSDMAFALALVHHLCITFSFSFDQVFGLCKQFTSRFLIIEFIPKDDTQAQSLLNTLPDVFDDYTEANFELALSHTFTLMERVPIQGTKRIVYLATVKNDTAV
jgi:hypothetical protein